MSLADAEAIERATSSRVHRTFCDRIIQAFCKTHA